MANIKKSQPTEAKVVKTYRIKPAMFKIAEEMSNQKYGTGVAGIVEQLIENHFGLNAKKK